MPVASESINPFEFATVLPNTSADEASVSDPVSEVVAYGPLSFQDFSHGQQLIVRGDRRVMLFILALVGIAFAIMSRFEGFWTVETAIRSIANGIVIVGMSIVAWWLRKKSIRDNFDASPPVRRWLISPKGIQCETDQAKTFVPFRSIVNTEVSDRVAYVRSNTNATLLIPRAAFTSDDHWRLFLAWLQGKDGCMSKQSSDTNESECEVQNAEAGLMEEGLVIDGPMTDAEAEYFLSVVDRRASLLAKYALLVLGLVFCGMAAATLILGESMYVNLASALPCLLIGLLLLFLHFATRRRRWISVKAYQSWQIKNVGIVVTRDDHLFELPWNELSDLRVTENGMLVCVTNGCLLIPRSGFCNEEDWRRAIKIVRQNVGDR